uniref:Uncharacterized protein n=1 Tax=Anopheles darlingi TaxID=43151 RepID=A0A2M4D7M6_ANODA
MVASMPFIGVLFRDLITGLLIRPDPTRSGPLGHLNDDDAFRRRIRLENAGALGRGPRPFLRLFFCCFCLNRL